MGGRNTRTRVSEPIHGLAGRIRSIARGTISFASGDASKTLTITAVDTAKTVVRGGGHDMESGTGGGDQTFFSAPWLDSATTVKSNRLSTGDRAAKVRFELTEYY